MVAAVSKEREAIIRKAWKHCEYFAMCSFKQDGAAVYYCSIPEALEPVRVMDYMVPPKASFYINRFIFICARQYVPQERITHYEITCEGIILKRGFWAMQDLV